MLLDVVWAETVAAGRAGGYADAAALEAAFAGHELVAAPAASHVDAAVLAAAVSGPGALVANDLALGRRARNLGVTWIRTADLAVIGVATGAFGADDGKAAIISLRDSGRMAGDLAAAYLEEMEHFGG
ncbi:MAG: hypothetical protein ACRDZ3_14945 [Acidimicrobiia bacterium]